MGWPPSADETGQKSKGRNIMKKTIEGKEYYLLSSDLNEVSFFIRHLSTGEQPGCNWELKRIYGGKVRKMEKEVFRTSSDVLKRIAELNDEDVDELTLYATLNDEDGSVDAKTVKVRYELYVRTLEEDVGFDCGGDIADDAYDVGGEDNIESYTGDLSWVYENRDETPEEIYNSNKEHRVDREMTESYFIEGTDVKIHEEEEVWENSYIEENYLQNQ